MDERTREIVAGLREGRREAWSALYDAHAERVWRAVSRLMGGRAADVADVVQEVFLAAAKSAGQYDPARGTPWHWLMGIARRQVALRYRRQVARLARARRWWLGLDGATREWLAGGRDAPPDVLESKELAALVRAALLRVPVEYQTLLTSRYLDGASAVEMAAGLGSTPEAVRAKLMRARRAFRAAFMGTVRHEGALRED
jgi:RNA polymerase sigma-70 factor (ECF subfamily)